MSDTDKSLGPDLALGVGMAAIPEGGIVRGHVPPC
jgi:hypothetical protein